MRRRSEHRHRRVPTVPGRKSPRLVIGLAAGCALAIAASVAYATIPSGGVISACYAQKTGALRVVDPATACGRGELALSWNQQGAQGLAGPEGPAGPQGPAGDGATFASRAVVPVTSSTESAPSPLLTVGDVELSGGCVLVNTFNLTYVLAVTSSTGQALDAWGLVTDTSGAVHGVAQSNASTISIDAINGRGLSLMVVERSLDGAGAVFTGASRFDVQLSTSDAGCVFNVLGAASQ